MRSGQVKGEGTFRLSLPACHEGSISVMQLLQHQSILKTLVLMSHVRCSETGSHTLPGPPTDRLPEQAKAYLLALLAGPSRWRCLER